MDDIKLFQNWGNKALKSGLSSLYLENITDYPPLYVYILKFNSWLALKLFNNNQVLSSHYIFISKTIPLLCNLFIGIFLFVYLKKDCIKALLASSLYLFNLGVIYNTSYWGQVDSVNAVLMFLSIFFLVKKKYLVSTILISLATLIKIYSVILLPIVGIVIFLECDYKILLKIFFYNILIILIILLPFILGGAFPLIIKTYFNSFGAFPYITVGAHNIWFLVYPLNSNLFIDGLKDTHIILDVSLRKIGITLFLIYTILNVYKLIRNRNKCSIIFAASSMAFAFFMIPTEIHERYLFSFFPVFALIAYKKKKYILIYILSSITYLINLMMILNFNSNSNFIFSPIQTIINIFILKFSYKIIGITMAIVNLLIFIYLTVINFSLENS